MQIHLTTEIRTSNGYILAAIGPWRSMFLKPMAKEPLSDQHKADLVDLAITLMDSLEREYKRRLEAESMLKDAAYKIGLCRDDMQDAVGSMTKLREDIQALRDSSEEADEPADEPESEPLSFPPPTPTKTEKAVKGSKPNKKRR